MSSALSGMVNQTNAWVADGVVPLRMGNAHPSLFPYEPLPTKEGELIVTAGNDAQFGRLCQVIGAPELATDPRFARNEGRTAHRDQLKPLTYRTPVPAYGRRMVPGADRGRGALRADQHGGRWG